MKPLNILVVGGHPADSFDHCGGTLAHHARRGDRVVVGVLTHGLRENDVLIADELRLQAKVPDPKKLEKLMQERAKVKYAEVVEALDILGVREVHFLNYDDNVLLVTHELIEKVARLIREIKPDVVITHYPLEDGGVASHHGNTGEIVLNAIKSAGTVVAGDPNLGHRVAQVFFMSPKPATFPISYLGGLPPCFCDYYVDITDVIELKVKAWDRMRSQQYGGDHARKAAECWNGKDGRHMDVAYAEGFLRHWPEIGEYLVVSKERLKRANEPRASAFARSDRLIAPFVKLPKD